MRKMPRLRISSRRAERPAAGRLRRAHVHRAVLRRRGASPRECRGKESDKAGNNARVAPLLLLSPTEAPSFMRGYSRADLPYEQPTKTDPDGECGSCWQDDIIINHFHYEPCHTHKERRHNDP